MTANPLEPIKKMAERLVAAEAELEELKAKQKQLAQEIEDLAMNLLPAAMNNFEMTTLGVGNRVVVVEPFIKATLPAEPAKRKAAIEFVIDQGHGGVVQYGLDVTLPKGDEAMEHKVIDALTALDPNLKPRVTAEIHHSTYSAICRQLVMTSDKPVPKEILGIYVASKAKVT